MCVFIECLVIKVDRHNALGYFISLFWLNVTHLSYEYFAWGRVNVICVETKDL